MADDSGHERNHGRAKARGRFEKGPDPTLQEFSSSVHVDRKLGRQDIRGSIAHARMLAQQGVIGADEAEALEKGLLRVAAELESGELELKPELEDIHMNVEARLGDLVGAVAGKLHSGRSRNDQVATGFTLWMREQIPVLRAAVLELRTVLVERAAEEIDVVLPGYTHLQRAQPVRLAHHWLAHVAALGRDDGRLSDARKRMGLSPLGAGALAGTTLPIDREATARELGFDGPNPNSLDAVASRDGALELLSALSTLMIHLSRIAEEIVLWNSSEFGFIALDDSFATGSSLMPQKKNPDGAELVRGKSGRVVGNLVSLLMTMKALPLTYNRDMQEDKEPVFDSVETVQGSLEVLAGTIRSLRVDADAMRAAASDPMLLATDVAEHLVRTGVPFREAYGIVGRLVAHAVATGTPLDQVPRSELREFHPELDVEASERMSLDRALESRALIGGPARATVEAAIEDARRELERTADELQASST